MTVQEELAHLRAENQKLREAFQQTQKWLRVALARIEEVEKQKTPPSAFVKANVNKPKAEEKKPRQKRDGKHNRGRVRAVPTQIVEHRIVNCPDCQARLGGVSVARGREVMDLAPPPPVDVIHHQIFKGWCAGCQKWHEAPVDFSSKVLGQGRMGVRLTSLIATLQTVMRLPLRQIRDLLHTLHGVQVSVGELAEVLHRLVAHAQPALAALKTALQASPAVQADETGWREDGSNGSIWSCSTPTLRYYEDHVRTVQSKLAG
ncbi:MAG: IS66 family transposase [Ktedonobacteraceae bacterium]